MLVILKFQNSHNIPRRPTKEGGISGSNRWGNERYSHVSANSHKRLNCRASGSNAQTATKHSRRWRASNDENLILRNKGGIQDGKHPCLVSRVGHDIDPSSPPRLSSRTTGAEVSSTLLDPFFRNRFCHCHSTPHSKEAKKLGLRLCILHIFRHSSAAKSVTEP